MPGRGLFKRLLTVDEAIDRVHGAVGERLRERMLRDTSSVPVWDLAGRIVAESVRALRSLPWYPRSIVDGCAVRSSDVAGAFEDRPVELRVLGRVRIGTRPAVRVGIGECALVDTGSWVPLGADAVVPIEYIRLEDGRALVERGRPPGANIALPASDVSEGDVVAWRGAPATPEVAAALASLGIRSVKASRRLRVAVVSTGEELVEPGEEPGEAGIFDSNRYFLLNTFRLAGFEVADGGIVGDSVDDVAAAIQRHIDNGADLIVTSGGTSAGVDDVVPRAVERLGRLIFHGLRIKPGKPTLAGVVGDAIVVGLPGNPRSTANVVDKFLYPLLSRLGVPLGPVKPEMRLRATLLSSVEGERGRDTIIPVALAGELAVPLARESYMIASYAAADGYIVVPASSMEPLRMGETVEVRAWRPPSRSVLVATDTRLWKPPEGVRAIYAPMPWEEAEKLAGSGIASIAAAPAGAATGRWARIGVRRVVLVSRSSRCQEAAVFSPYVTMYPDLIPGEARVIPVRRAAGAASLYSDGYVDCTVIPEDYASNLPGNMTPLAQEAIVATQK